MPFTLLTSSAYSTLDATKLTGNLPAISGASLTGISGGKVLQIVQSNDNTGLSLSAGAEYTQLRTAITPSATSSKILVMVTLGLTSSDYAADVGFDIQRDSTALQVGTGGGTNSTTGAFMNHGSGEAFNAHVSLLDTPNSTSAINYKVISRSNSPRTLVINKRGNNDSLRVSSQMILMEIGA